MFKDIPQVIRETFWKHLLLSAAIVGFGIIWSVIAGDRILSLLTGTIALLSAVRLVSLYRSIKRGHFTKIEGVVHSDRKEVLRRCHILTMQLQDGSEICERITGGTLLKPTNRYRIYLLGTAQEMDRLSLPGNMTPAQILLGAELLEYLQKSE